jgi:4-amino-4-deoxy-L-arabinose transferase-like glycosyltransferase
MIWLIVTAYNLYKPFHIDDTAYLEIAKWISAHQLHPMSGILNWNGIDEPAYRTNQPPLYFYLMALWSRLFGFSEPAMHSLQSLSALACILLFYRLACVFARDLAVWLTALLALGPAFIVEQNMMIDVPLLAVWLLFFNLLIAPGSNQTARYVMAALACSVAVLMKYSSLVLLPVLCLSLLIERRKKEWWTTLLPLLAVAGWSLFNYFDYGAVHIATRPPSGVTEKWRQVKYAITWIVTLGGITPLGLIALAQSRSTLIQRQKIIYTIVTLSFVALVIVGIEGWVPERWSSRLLGCVFAANGFFCLVFLWPAAMDAMRIKFWNVENTRAAAPQFYLLVWLAGTSIFYMLLAPFIAVRHVLLILPPLIIILASGWNTRLTGYSRTFGLALTIVISAALCISDLHYANFFKTEAAVLGPALPRTGTAWTSGHWGWQWYATLAGMRQVDVRNSVLRSGDLLVVARSSDIQPLASPPPMHLIRTDKETGSFQELFCTGKRTGFYAYSKWDVPWYLSRDCGNSIEVFQVE